MKLNSYEKWKSSLTGLAEGYLDAGEGAKAASLLQNLLTIRPEEMEARRQYFSALLLAKDVNRAKREGLFLSMIYLSQKKPEKSKQILSELLPHFPLDLNLKLKLAKLFAASGQPEKAETLYNEAAEQYLAANVPLGAVEIYSTLYELNPKAHQYREKIALSYHREGILDKAIEEYFRLAEIFMNEKQTAEGTAVLETILSIDPVNERASFQLAETYIKVKKIKEAIELMRRQVENRLYKEKFEEAASISNRFIQLLTKKKYLQEANDERENLAMLLLDRGREEEAIGLLEEVALAASSAGQTDKYLAILERELQFFRKKGDPEQTLDLYKRMILTAAPADANEARALTARFIQDYKEKELKVLDQAIRSISKSLKEKDLADEADEMMAALGDIYASKNKVEEAIKIFNAILQKKGKNIHVMVRLADLYADEGEAEKALSLYKKSIELSEAKDDLAGAVQIFNLANEKIHNNTQLLAFMGGVYFRRQEWDKALKLYESALNVDPKSRDAVVGTAMTYAKKGMLKEMARLAEGLSNKALVNEIVEEYRKALAATTTVEKAAMALGLLYFDLGHHKEASAEFETAARDGECFVTATNHLGLCYKNLGQNDLAAREFKNILDNASLSDDETLDVRYNLAVTYEEMGKREEASDLYHDILVSDIGYKDVNSRLRNLTAAARNKKVVSFPKKEKS